MELAMQTIPTVPGTPFEGGFYVGRIRVSEEVFALIVAPMPEGDFDDIAWGEYPRDVPGARSFFDGQANTLAMAEAGSELAQRVLRLDINGFKDWYLPSRDELELLYRHLKPTTQENWRWRGDNPSSIPVGYAYSSEAPAQTTDAAFQAGAEQALQPTWYWSSTQYSAHSAWCQLFGDGGQYYDGKSSELRARAVRRFKAE
jgi:hypothetical protein